jgi:ankyrin repeat protein
MSVSPTARKRLPVNPSADHLRKQAKRRARADAVPLSEAQHRLALEYGAKHWAELMHVVETMRRGADRREAAGAPELEPLPAAANANDLARVRALLAEGEFTQHDLDLALARAVLRFAEREAIARLLVEHGADPDGQYGADYGPIVLVTGEALDVDGLRFLLDAGCDAAAPPVATKYGEQCALSAWLGTYLRGRGDAKRCGIDLLLAHGAHVPAEITPAMLAVHRDDAAALASVLDADAGLVARAFDRLPYVELPGGTLLHYACALGAAACVRALVDRGADVRARAANGRTPTSCAASGASPDELRLLLDRGAYAWLEDAEGKTPADHARAAVANPHAAANARLLSEVVFDDDGLRRAVELVDAGDVEGLRALLAAEPRLVTERVRGDSALTRGYFHAPTLLHFVAQNPNRAPHMPPRIVESARAILDAGAIVDALAGDPPSGTTLALVASSKPAHDDGLVRPLAQLLVERGADPAAAIEAAMLHRLPETVRLLHELGAPPTPVSAAGLGELAALRALVAAGLTDDDRLRAAWAAATNGQADAIDLLLAAGLPVDERLPRPYAPTLLHEAAWHGHRAVCERLLAHGADRTLRDTQFAGTPAGWAAEAGHAALAELLR